MTYNSIEETDQTITFGFVIPVYKTKKEYLDQCVSSILNQTYQNIKIVMVDDASPDHCGAACEKWAKMDRRIKVVHHDVNRGLPCSRNTGIETIDTDWVAFVDSDDWVEPDMCGKLFKYIKKERADIYVFSGYRNNAQKQTECGFHFPQGKVFALHEDREQLQKQLFYNQTEGGCVADAFPIQSVGPRLYRMEFLRGGSGVRFIDVRFAEDALMHMYSIESADKVIYLQERFYHYRDTSGSMVNSYRVHADTEQLSVMKAMWEFADNAHKDSEFKRWMYIFSFMSMQMCVWQKYYHPQNADPKKIRKRECKALFENEPYCATLQTIQELPVSRLRRNQRLKYYLMKYHFYGLMVWMRKFTST